MLQLQQYIMHPRNMMSHRTTRRSNSCTLLTMIFIVWTASMSLTVDSVRNIQVAYPLRSLTIWDREVQVQDQRQQQQQPSLDDTEDHKVHISDSSLSTFRSKFLSKFRIGLQAEVNARNALISQPDIVSSLDVSKNDKQKISKANESWALKAARMDQKKHSLQEKFVEEAYDKAVSQFDKISQPTTRRNNQNPNKYQFVGVINHKLSSRNNNQDEPPIVWYTRLKPKNAKWTLRLIHVNRQAILKDLYNRKKIDIFAQYNNRGTLPVQKQQQQQVDGSPSSSVPTFKPVVTAQYHVRERTWKNLWNMSLKHMFTDSSGMYWRERRIHNIKNQYYTDGTNVYESTYRYVDGRNGMHRVSSLQELLNSRSIDQKMKQQVLQRLAKDVPDIVLEE